MSRFRGSVGSGVPGFKVRGSAILGSAIAFGVAVACGLVLSAQSPQQGFRGSVDLVRTDVSVIDNRTGRPVSGLTEKDFVVTENGKRQTVTHFIAENGIAESGERGSGAKADVRRSMVFVLAYNNRFAIEQPYERLARYLRTSLRTGDQAAVLTWNRVTAFTSNGEALAQVVERAGRMPDELLEAIKSNRGRDFLPEVEAAIDKWLAPDHPPGFLRSTVSLVLGVPEYEEVHRHWNRMSRMSVNPLMQVGAAIEHLRHEPGERRIVQVSLWGVSAPFRVNEMPNIDNEVEEKDLARRLTDAGIALDLINTYGTTRGPGPTLSGMNLARLSGGHFTSLRVVDEQLARIDEASRYGYVIGYSPANPKLDGRYRNLDVKVNRPGVTVAFRRGYTAVVPLRPEDVRANRTRARLDEASEAASDALDITFTATPSVIGLRGGREARVDLSIKPEGLALPEFQGRREGIVNVLVLWGDRSKKLVGRAEKALSVRLDSTAYETALQSGLPYSVTVPVTGEPEYVKIIVYAYDADRMGSRRLQIK
jgi:VWFA-related protein